MAVTPNDIQSLPSADFVGVDAGIIQRHLDEAAREVNPSVFGERTDDAVLYLTAHLVAVMMQGAEGPTGPVVSEQAGPVSRTFAARGHSNTGSDLEATAYGRRYQAICSQVAGGPRVL